jgi:GTP-binding protein
VVDTGGLKGAEEGLDEPISSQTRLAVNAADVIVLLVDARNGLTAADEIIARQLKKSNKPLILVVNKVDGLDPEQVSAEFYGLGIASLFPVAAAHGRGLALLIEAIVAQLPAKDDETAEALDAYAGIRVAIVGRPNVGKSSLLNRLAGQQRVVVDEVAGTTVDPVDELIELDGQVYRFIDTAGIRRRVKEASGHEYYASLRTRGAVERAEVCVVVIDASESVTEQDLRVLTSVEEAGRALVIAFNKWDLTDDERRRYLRREIERDLVQFEWAAKINISATTGRHVDRLGSAIEEALDSWETRIPTGRLNAFLGRIVAAHPHPVRGGKQPRILFATQAQAGPPTFVLFTSGQVEAGYLRFIERRLREEFGFLGTPVHVEVRAREKRKSR